MITRTTSENPEFQKLVTLLDAHLLILDGEEHEFFSQFNGIENIKNVVVYSVDNKVIGCGAIKEYNTQIAEVKRMFVQPDFRKQGIAEEILKALEIWAKELNYKQLYLETGINNPSAQSVYKKCNFIQIQNYGPYFGVVSSICMEKLINY
jgi:putative acetyltransferase